MDDLSNFELNCEVMRMTGVKLISDTPVNGAGVRCNNSFTRDFCSEKDGARLMINERIGLRPINHRLWRAFSECGLWCHAHENPWRAVTVVYLKKKKFYAEGGEL